MAWTSPMTFVAGNVLTAAQLNTHLRDNLFESSVSRASTANEYFVVTGKNQIQTRQVQMAVVNTAEATASEEWTGLTTPGPSVTVTTSTRALIFTHVESTTTGVGSFRAAAFAVSGATTRDPVTSTYIRQDGQSASGRGLGFGQVDLMSTLTPGDNTFTLMYRSGPGATATFKNRRILVWPL